MKTLDERVTEALERDAKRTPFLWLRTLCGEPDWAEDCVGLTQAEVMKPYCFENNPDCAPKEGYAAIPLYSDAGPDSDLIRDLHAENVKLRARVEFLEATLTTELTNTMGTP